jgi:hypothetical protein
LSADGAFIVCRDGGAPPLVLPWHALWTTELSEAIRRRRYARA